MNNDFRDFLFKNLNELKLKMIHKKQPGFFEKIYKTITNPLRKMQILSTQKYTIDIDNRDSWEWNINGNTELELPVFDPHRKYLLPFYNWIRLFYWTIIHLDNKFKKSLLIDSAFQISNIEIDSNIYKSLYIQIRYNNHPTHEVYGNSHLYAHLENKYLDLGDINTSTDPNEKTIMENYLQETINRNGLYIFNLDVEDFDSEGNAGWHSCYLIIQNLQNNIEIGIYDPHGYAGRNNNINSMIIQKISKYLLCFGKPINKIILFESCVRVGIQDGDTVGFCVMFSHLWLYCFCICVKKFDLSIVPLSTWIKNIDIYLNRYFQYFTEDKISYIYGFSYLLCVNIMINIKDYSISPFYKRKIYRAILDKDLNMLEPLITSEKKYSYTRYVIQMIYNFIYKRMTSREVEYGICDTDEQCEEYATKCINKLCTKVDDHEDIEEKNRLLYLKLGKHQSQTQYDRRKRDGEECKLDDDCLSHICIDDICVSNDSMNID